MVLANVELMTCIYTNSNSFALRSIPSFPQNMWLAREALEEKCLKTRDPRRKTSQQVFQKKNKSAD